VLLTDSHGNNNFLSSLLRFTKNLSPDKINLSTLKGEGQLTNLELDEEVLQNVLELPTWLAITRVYCNRASIRVRMGMRVTLLSSASSPAFLRGTSTALSLCFPLSDSVDKVEDTPNLLGNGLS
jgi:hypothetical protein